MFGKFLTDGEKVLDNWREVPKNYLEIPAFLWNSDFFIEILQNSASTIFDLLSPIWMPRKKTYPNVFHDEISSTLRIVTLGGGNSSSSKKWRKTFPQTFGAKNIQNTKLGGGWTTHLKNMLVKLDHFPK